MSNSKDNEPKFNEFQAYEELCMIIKFAIENESYETLEQNIAIWEKKYPLADFTDLEIVRKIKVILNRDYLARLVGDYLASKVLHTQEKTRLAYEKLQKIIDTARKTKDYKKAQAAVVSWKESLANDGLSLYSFNKSDFKKICTMLLFPSKEIAKQKEAAEALQKLVEASKGMNSLSLTEEISNWQSSYSLAGFPDELKSEITEMTSGIFETISVKGNEEQALKEITELVVSDNVDNKNEAITLALSKYNYDKFSDESKSKITELTLTALSIDKVVPEVPGNSEVANTQTYIYIPPVQQEAIFELKNLLSHNSHDIEGIFNWIYLNRKIDFVPNARDEIKALFSIAGFRKPQMGQYSIPSLESSFDSKSIKKVREQVVLNYLGLLYLNDAYLSQAEKSKISELHTAQENLYTVKDKNDGSEVSIVIPVEEDEMVLDEKGQKATSQIEEDMKHIDTSIPDIEEAKEAEQTGESIPTIEVAKDSEAPDNYTPTIEVVNDSEETDNSVPIVEVTKNSEEDAKCIETSTSSSESSSEINIVIEDILKDPLASFKLSTKKSHVIEEDTSLDVEPPKKEKILEDEHSKEAKPQLPVEETSENVNDTETEKDLLNEIPKQPITDSRSFEPVQEDDTTNEKASMDDQSEEITNSNSILSEEDMANLEEINYIVNSRSIKQLPVKLNTRKSSRIDYLVTEKNNGF